MLAVISAHQRFPNASSLVRTIQIEFRRRGEIVRCRVAVLLESVRATAIVIHGTQLRVGLAGPIEIDDASVNISLALMRAPATRIDFAIAGI
jgi:hypothetical protein